MSGQEAIRVLLGPQRPASNLGAAVTSLSLPDGPLATISAGWQEAEGDIDDVTELAGRPLRDLGLYQRAERLMQDHDDLRNAYRQRQDRLTEQQRYYARRLRHLMVATRELMRSDGDATLINAEKRHAIAQLRALDRHHLQRVQLIHREFDDRFNVSDYAPLASHHAEIADILASAPALIITGGNVIVLLNRMRLFGIEPLLLHCNIVAWSAGAMVLSDTIVLFHDRLPEGRRDAELLGTGFGLVPGHVILPDAEHRLRYKDKTRLSLFCHRFAPASCALLNTESMLRFESAELRVAESVSRIKHNGSIGMLRAK